MTGATTKVAVIVVDAYEVVDAAVSATAAVVVVIVVVVVG